MSDPVEARQRVRRAQAVLDGFRRRKGDAENRLERLEREAAQLREALAAAPGEEAEAIAELEEAQRRYDELAP